MNPAVVNPEFNMWVGGGEVLGVGAGVVMAGGMKVSAHLWLCRLCSTSLNKCNFQHMVLCF